MDDIDDDDLKNKHLCFKCTTEEYLGAEISKEGKRAQCDYCGETRQCYSLDELADRVETAFRTALQTDIRPTRCLSIHDAERPRV